MFGYGRFVIVSSASVGNVFFESGREISASLADVHLPTFTGDPVHSSFGLLVLLVLVGLQAGLEFLGR